MERDVMEQVNTKIKHMVSEVLQQLEQVYPEKQMNDLFHDSSKYSNRKWVVDWLIDWFIVICSYFLILYITCYIVFVVRKSSKEGSLPDKQFLMRNSLLTDLFKIKHIKTIYHIFIVILIILFINTAIYDIVDTGS